MRRNEFAILIAVPACLLLSAGAASAQVKPAGMTVSHPVAFAVSTAIPVRPLPPKSDAALAPNLPTPRYKPRSARCSTKMVTGKRVFLA